MAGEKEARLIVRLLDGVTGPSHKVMRSLGRVSAAAGRMNRMMIMPNTNFASTARQIAGWAAAYVGVTKGLDGTLGAARRMQAALTEIGIKSGLTETQLAGLGAQMTALSPKVNQTTSELLSGVDAMVTLGLDAKSAAAAMPAVGKAATATMSSISDLSAASVAAMQNMKVAPSEISKMLDAMAEAGNQGAFEMRDMASAFPALTASAKSLGIEGVKGVTDMAAALQIARRGAGDASSAANNMSNFLQKIMAPATIKNFQKFGVNVTKELQKAHKKGISPIEHFIGLVDEKTKGGRADLLGQLFGDKQVLEFVRPMIADFKDYIKIRGDAERASGTVAAAFARRMQNADEKMKAFSIRMRNLGRGLGEHMLDPLGNAAQYLTHVLDTLGKRATVLDNIKAAFDGFSHGAGFKSATEALTAFGQAAEKFLFGSVDNDAGARLAEIFKRFDEWGASVKRFTDSITGNPIGKFLGEMAGYGFKFMLASTAISIFAGALWKLGRAAAFLSGLTAAAGIIKGLIKAGAVLTGAGAAIAGTGAKVATKAVPAGAVAATSAGAVVAEKVATAGKSTAAIDTLVASGRSSTAVTGLDKFLLGMTRTSGLIARFAARLTGWLAIPGEITARALIAKGPADERFIDPNYSVWALRDAENRQAGRETAPAPAPSEPKPFSLKGLWQDLMAPIKPTVDSSEIDKFVAESDEKAELAHRALSITAKPTIDASSIDVAMRKLAAFAQHLADLDGASVSAGVPASGGDHAMSPITEGIGHRASGGPVRRGLTYEINERGTETVTMGTNGYVTPAHRLGEDGTDRTVERVVERGTQTINFGPFNIYGASTDDVMAKIRQEINRGLDRSRQLSLDGRPVTT